MKPVTHYQAFLIRTWAEDCQEKDTWRCRVQNVQTGKQHGFVTVDDLLDFLNDMFAKDVESTTDDE